MKFNETKSQERLINLMLQAGVEWPDKCTHAVQSGIDGYILFSTEKPIKSNDGWCYYAACTPVSLCKPLPNWHQTIITREQYEARDGWITWHGGECPVDKKRYVQVITAFDQAEPEVSMARHFIWKQSHTRIVAYRIHKEQDTTEPCESVKSFIPDQPTIEQLIDDWKRKLASADVSLAQADHDAEQAEQAAAAVRKALADAGWSA